MISVIAEEAAKEIMWIETDGGTPKLALIILNAINKSYKAQTWKVGDILGGTVFLDSRYKIINGPYIENYDGGRSVLVDVEVLIHPSPALPHGEIIKGCSLDILEKVDHE